MRRATVPRCPFAGPSSARLGWEMPWNRVENLLSSSSRVSLCFLPCHQWDFLQYSVKNTKAINTLENYTQKGHTKYICYYSIFIFQSKRALCFRQSSLRQHYMQKSCTSLREVGDKISELALRRVGGRLFLPSSV